MVELRNIMTNQNVKQLDSKGCFTILEHEQDMSTDASTVALEYFMQKMHLCKRQVLISLNNSSARVQAGAMQWIAGAVESETGLGGGLGAVGKLLGGIVKGAVTGESAVKPVYRGTGFVMLEPTYKYIILEDVSSWGADGIVLQDGLFLACESSVQEKVISRKNLSSVFAGHGLFNLSLKGCGIAALELPVPREELFEFNLENDCLKIDGNMAIAWSGGLELTVERSSKTLLGSMVNGEGVVNVFRGTGKLLMAPTISGTDMLNSQPSDNTKAKATKGIGDAISNMLDNN